MDESSYMQDVFNCFKMLLEENFLDPNYFDKHDIEVILAAAGTYFEVITSKRNESDIKTPIHPALIISSYSVSHDAIFDLNIDDESWYASSDPRISAVVAIALFYDNYIKTVIRGNPKINWKQYLYNPEVDYTNKYCLSWWNFAEEARESSNLEGNPIIPTYDSPKGLEGLNIPTKNRPSGKFPIYNGKPILF